MIIIVFTGEDDIDNTPESCPSHAEATELHAEGTNGAGPPKQAAKKSKHPVCTSTKVCCWAIIVCVWVTSTMLCAGPKESLKQTEPPSIPVAKLFPKGIFPEGERQPYTEEYAT